jgi:hypothetical protein
MALKHGSTMVLHRVLTDFEERADEPVDSVSRAMVGVEGDVHRVLVGDGMGELG